METPFPQFPENSVPACTTLPTEGWNRGRVDTSGRWSTMPQPSCPSEPDQHRENVKKMEKNMVSMESSLLFPTIPLNIAIDWGILPFATKTHQRRCRNREHWKFSNVCRSVLKPRNGGWKNVKVNSQCHSHDSAWHWEVRAVSQPLRLIHLRGGSPSLCGVLLHTSFSKHLRKWSQ